MIGAVIGQRMRIGEGLRRVQPVEARPVDAPHLGPPVARGQQRRGPVGRAVVVEIEGAHPQHGVKGDPFGEVRRLVADDGDDRHAGARAAPPPPLGQAEGGVRVAPSQPGEVPPQPVAPQDEAMRAHVRSSTADRGMAPSGRHAPGAPPVIIALDRRGQSRFVMAHARVPDFPRSRRHPADPGGRGHRPDRRPRRGPRGRGTRADDLPERAGDRHRDDHWRLSRTIWRSVICSIRGCCAPTTG